MKKLLFFLIFGLVAHAEATPSRVRDGSIHFPVCTVNGTYEWDQSTCDYYVGQGTGTVTAVVPQQFELNLSTILVVNIRGRNIIGFDSNSDFLDCQTKVGLQEKIRQIRILINSYQDFPAAVTREYNERAGWLRAYYLTLP